MCYNINIDTNTKGNKMKNNDEKFCQLCGENEFVKESEDELCLDCLEGELEQVRLRIKSIEKSEDFFILNSTIALTIENLLIDLDTYEKELVNLIKGAKK